MQALSIKLAGLDRLEKEILHYITNVSDELLKEIANGIVETVKQKIHESIKRAGSTGKLENAFFAEPITNGWGVGNIDYLNSNVPYWRHINYGSEAIGANWKHRVPRGGFNPSPQEPTEGVNNGRWVEGLAGFSFIPSRPIPPVNYIAKTTVEIPNIVNKVLARGI